MKERLRNLRIESGMTQKQLAQTINSTNKNIWAYENGLATPPIDVLKSYADTFNVSVDYLLGRTDDLGATIPTAQDLSRDEREVLELYAALSPTRKEDLMIFLRALSGNPADSASKKKA